MRRVVVLGPGGAGKSDFSRALARRTGLPVVHLDRLFWRPGWKPAPRDEAVGDLAAAIRADRWILDGNFLDAGDARFERADTVVFLDLPRATCLWRVLRRLVRDRRRDRVDLPDGCREGFDPALLRWIWRYPREDRPRVLGVLGELDGRVAVHRLCSSAEVRRYLESVVA
ncbi:MAG TPA: isopentenyl transferase family protein [Gaiellaceae bacterium]|nr:isopentenyl transferase family protein [Gaiellaceae bacterium]